ncbi:MAG: polyphosphate:AMP phosphotransferase [Lysobacterales bacterium]
MFESAEVGHRISKSDYRAQAPLLREALLKAQYELLKSARFPVLILIGGVDGAGKGETVNLLNEWMDPRHIVTHAFSAPSEEEAQRPPMWRYWRALPPKGKIGILFGSWYSDPILRRAEGEIGDAELIRSIEEIRHFERMLVSEGALILKFWFHISKAQQKQRLTELSADPSTRWRVSETDWERYHHYKRFRKVSELTLRETSTGDAPWILVEGSDPHYRYLTVGTQLLNALTERLAGSAPPPTVTPAPLAPPLDTRNVLNVLDYACKLEKKPYKRLLEKYQGRLNLLTRTAAFRKRSLIVVFEGQDAAGKGSSIRRITGALDARHYQVIPIAAPTEEERAQPYLWRFWRHLPPKGRVTIFDRSWYGRLLVERVEGFCAEADWMRAFHEINAFEEQLVQSGAIVVKFWLAITQEEQLARFKQRQETAFKQYKITDEDWRNREKWPQYERAVCDMIERCSTELAPWHLIPANDKLHARIEILKTLCAALQE